MSYVVNVLMPSGHRQVVKVTPNTSILQILEEACNRRGYSPAEYDLRHFKRILDTSSTVRFSNLPNNAQLELIPAAREKVETAITLVLQLADGERVMSDFPSTITLWNILTHCQEKSKQPLLQLNDENGAALEPVCIYIRQEIVGEEMLKQTTLRSLGLTGGKAIIRLIHRLADKPVQQAYVENLNLAPLKEEVTNSRPASPIWDVDWTATLPQTQLQADLTNTSEDQLPCTSGSYANTSREFHTSDTKDIKDLADTSGQVNKTKPDNESSEMEVDTSSHHLNESCSDEDQVIPLDEKGSLLFSLDDAPSLRTEEITDEFFDVTVDDVKVLFADLKKQREELENIPLQTQAMREATHLTRIKKYPKAVIRVTFPDRLVLQGSFRCMDNVSKLYEFVRSFLEDENMEFHLFITPPKRILEPQERLFEVPLVPTAVVHFACNSSKENVLKKDVLKKVSSSVAVRRSLSFMRQSNPTYINTSNINAASESTENFYSCSQTASQADTPSTSMASAQIPQSHGGAVPKWFQSGKK